MGVLALSFLVIIVLAIVVRCLCKKQRRSVKLFYFILMVSPAFIFFATCPSHPCFPFVQCLLQLLACAVADSLPCPNNSYFTFSLYVSDELFHVSSSYVSILPFDLFITSCIYISRPSFPLFLLVYTILFLLPSPVLNISTYCILITSFHVSEQFSLSPFTICPFHLILVSLTFLQCPPPQPADPFIP